MYMYLYLYLHVYLYMYLYMYLYLYLHVYLYNVHVFVSVFLSKVSLGADWAVPRPLFCGPFQPVVISGDKMILMIRWKNILIVRCKDILPTSSNIHKVYGDGNIINTKMTRGQQWICLDKNFFLSGENIRAIVPTEISVLASPSTIQDLVQKAVSRQVISNCIKISITKVIPFPSL